MPHVKDTQRDEMQTMHKADAPKPLPGHVPVIATPPDPMCPQKKARLQHACSDSYSASWVHNIK